MGYNDLNKDVSVLICSKNPGHTISEVLESVKKNCPLEIILIDANSTDGSREIAENYVDKIVTDPGSGLAVARNIGLREARGDYIFFCGPDNIIKPDTIKYLKDYLIKFDYVGVATQTRLKFKDQSFWTRCSNKRWELRFFEGQREVIGTPYLFKTSVLKEYKYSNEMMYSDDSDLCKRITESGLKVGYSDVISYEIGIETLFSLKNRYIMYGKSDSQYYNKYSSQWNVKRKVISFLHPFNSEFLIPISKIKSIKDKIYYGFFFFLITVIRYYGWLKNNN